MNQSVVSIESLEEKISKALNLLGEVVVDIDTKTIVQTVSQPVPSKKTGKRSGRPAGSKNKTAEAPATAGI